MHTGKLLGIQGFLPIIKANICEIDIPLSEKKDYVLQNILMENYQVNGVYDFLYKVPQSKKYFENNTIKYDKKKGIIQIGSEIQKGEMCIKVDENIMCGVDKNMNLKCVYIMPTEFINYLQKVRRN